MYISQKKNKNEYKISYRCLIFPLNFYEYNHANTLADQIAFSVYKSARTDGCCVIL